MTYRRKRAERMDKLRAILAVRFGCFCWWCKRELRLGGNKSSNVFATIDHIIKKEYGGTLKDDNARLACRKCNSGRHSRHWIQPDNSHLTLVNENHDNKPDQIIPHLREQQAEH